MKQRLLTFSLVAAGICVFQLGAATWTRYHDPRDRQMRGRTPQYRNGTEIVAVYVGSEACKASLKPGFSETVHTATLTAARHARREGKMFSTLGLAVGNSADAGFKYLEKFGPFDQISAGHGWLNNDAIHFIFQDLQGEPAIPQMIVLERQVVLLDPGFSLRNERVLVRIVGAPQIERWVAEGGTWQ